MIEIELNSEDLACAGFRRVDAEWDAWMLAAMDTDDPAQFVRSLAGPEAPKRRPRKPTLKSQLRAMWEPSRLAK
jgi:hypothetical protein